MPAVRKNRRSVEEMSGPNYSRSGPRWPAYAAASSRPATGWWSRTTFPTSSPTQIAALAAATLAVARRATLATECGTFREAVARGSDGYLAVYAAGDSAIMAVIGTSSLNVGMLQYRAHEIIERIAAHSGQIGALAAPVRAANGESARTPARCPGGARRPRPSRVGAVRPEPGGAVRVAPA